MNGSTDDFKVMSEMAYQYISRVSRARVGKLKKDTPDLHDISWFCYVNETRKVHTFMMIKRNSHQFVKSCIIINTKHKNKYVVITASVIYT